MLTGRLSRCRSVNHLNEAIIKSCLPSVYQNTYIRAKKVQSDLGRLCIKSGFVAEGLEFDGRGSSYVALGDTKVVCYVMPPSTMYNAPRGFKDKGNISLTISVYPTSRKVMPNNELLIMTNDILQSLNSVVLLNKYPSCLIQINILLLDDNGNTLPCCYNAITVALADACIEMRDVVAAISVYKISKAACLNLYPEMDVFEDHINLANLDVDDIEYIKEEGFSIAELHLGICINREEVALLVANDHCFLFHSLLNFAKEACKTVGEEIVKSLKNSFKNNSQIINNNKHLSITT